LSAADATAAFAIAGPTVAHCAAFAATLPLAASLAVPRIVRAGFALGLAALTLAHGAPPADCCDLASIAMVSLASALSGAAFGLTASIIASAASAAGSLFDAALAPSPAGVDTIFGGSAGPAGRLFPLGFAVALCSSGGLTRLIERFVSDGWIHSTANLAAHIAAALGRSCIDAALAIAWPAVCAACVATAAAGLIGRLAPRANALFLTAPIATALTLVALVSAASTFFIRFDDLAALAVRSTQMWSR